MKITKRQLKGLIKEVIEENFTKGSLTEEGWTYLDTLFANLDAIKDELKEQGLVEGDDYKSRDDWEVDKYGKKADFDYSDDRYYEPIEGYNEYLEDVLENKSTPKPTEFTDDEKADMNEMAKDFGENSYAKSKGFDSAIEMRDHYL